MGMEKSEVFAMGKTRTERVAIFGLDCADPVLMFERWPDHLPNIRRLMERGTYGPMTSTIPPITVPAWSCMASSKDPGTLGIYGFRNRKDHSYDGLSIATSADVRHPRLWDILSRHGKRNIIVGVPGTYPITHPPSGCMISCFLTPDIHSEYTYPRDLKRHIADWVGTYMVDVKEFRTDNKKWLLEQIYQMTDKRFTVVQKLLASQPWDFFFMVEMGHDRIHHGFWQYMDHGHRRYQSGNEFEHAIRDYYIHTDKLIGETLKHIDLDTTAVWLVSDHGAKCMVGGFCFNQWLINEGYLVLKQPATQITKFNFNLVDWSKTRVWGEGGYYGRCFINVQGREPQGIVPQDQYESLRDELIHRIESLTDPAGLPMNSRAYKPQNLYRESNGVPPDLVVIFGELNWRSVGSVGQSGIFTFENDTGPDDANHAMAGLYLYAHPSVPARGYVPGPTIYDVAPTVLNMMNLPVPSDMQGRSLLPVESTSRE